MSEKEKVEDKEIEEVVEAFKEYFDGLEALRARLEQRIGWKMHPKGSPVLKFDAEKVKWVPKVRDDDSKWELANDFLNPSNPDYAELKNFLKEVGGNVRSEGKYYWLFTNGDAVGRQDAGAVKHAKK